MCERGSLFIMQMDYLVILKAVRLVHMYMCL